VQGHGGCCQNLGQEVENIFERSQRDIVQEVYLTCCGSQGWGLKGMLRPLLSMSYLTMIIMFCDILNESSISQQFLVIRLG